MSLDSRETEEADRLYKRIPQGGISGAQGIVTEEYDQSSGKVMAFGFQNLSNCAYSA